MRICEYPLTTPYRTRLILSINHRSPHSDDAHHETTGGDRLFEENAEYVSICKHRAISLYVLMSSLPADLRPLVDPTTTRPLRYQNSGLFLDRSSPWFIVLGTYTVSRIFNLDLVPILAAISHYSKSNPLFLGQVWYYLNEGFLEWLVFSYPSSSSRMGWSLTGIMA